MKAYIHTMRGEPRDEECATAQHGFEKLVIECAPFSGNGTLGQGSREGFYAARGYARVPGKDSEGLARALGANVIHDSIMEKQLDE